jgi:hypothetical protein
MGFHFIIISFPVAADAVETVVNRSEFSGRQVLAVGNFVVNKVFVFLKIVHGQNL